MRFVTTSIIQYNTGNLSNNTIVPVDIPGMLATFGDLQRFTFNASLGVFVNGAVSQLSIGIIFPAAPNDYFYSAFFTSPVTPGALAGAYTNPTTDFVTVPGNAAGFYSLFVSGYFNLSVGGDFKFTLAQQNADAGNAVEILPGSCWMQCNPIS